MRAIQQGSLAKLQRGCTILQNVPHVKGQQFSLPSSSLAKSCQTLIILFNHAKNKQGTPVKLLSCEQQFSLQFSTVLRVCPTVMTALELLPCTGVGYIMYSTCTQNGMIVVYGALIRRTSLASVQILVGYFKRLSC